MRASRRPPYKTDRTEIIWTADDIEKFCAVASDKSCAVAMLSSARGCAAPWSAASPNGSFGFAQHNPVAAGGFFLPDDDRRCDRLIGTEDT
jgi:hypothetical protein